MKKFMIVAAVAALSVGAFAKCGDDPTGCKTVFNVKFSGKTATENAAETYKTVQKLSGKGTLTFTSEDYFEELKVKVGKQKFDIVLKDGELTKWTYFGKKLDTVLDDNKIKPGKTYKLESDLGIKFEGQTGFDEDYTGDEDYQINVNQVAFGKVKVYITKEGKSHCGDGTKACLRVVTPVSYKGWFTGDFTPVCLDEEEYDDCCVVFEGSEIALIGGTWSAKYDKKNSRKGSCTATTPVVAE